MEPVSTSQAAEVVAALLSEPITRALIFSAITLAIAYVADKVLRAIVAKGVERNLLTPSSASQLEMISSIMVYGFALLLVFYYFTQASELIYMLIGIVLITFLGAYDALANLISHYVILMTKAVTPGTLISIEGIEGRVKNVQSLYTELRAPDGSIIRIPNKKLLQAVLQVKGGAIKVPLTVTISVKDEGTLDYEGVLRKIEDVDRRIKAITRSYLPELRILEISKKRMVVGVSVYTTSDRQVHAVVLQYSKMLVEALADYEVVVRAGR